VVSLGSYLCKIILNCLATVYIDQRQHGQGGAPIFDIYTQLPEEMRAYILTFLKRPDNMLDVLSRVSLSWKGATATELSRFRDIRVREMPEVFLCNVVAFHLFHQFEVIIYPNGLDYGVFMDPERVDDIMSHASAPITIERKSIIINPTVVQGRDYEELAKFQRENTLKRSQEGKKFADNFMHTNFQGMEDVEAMPFTMILLEKDEVFGDSTEEVVCKFIDRVLQVFEDPVFLFDIVLADGYGEQKYKNSWLDESVFDMLKWRTHGSYPALKKSRIISHVNRDVTLALSNEWFTKRYYLSMTMEEMGLLIDLQSSKDSEEF